MKKIIAAVLLLSLMLSAVACSTNEKVEKEDEKETEVEEKTEEATDKKDSDDDEATENDDFYDIVSEDITDKYPELEYIIEAEDYEDLKELDEDTIEAVISLKDDIVNGFGTLLDAADVDVDVDEKTGMITFNADILFDHDKYELKDGAKEQLDKVMRYYAPIVLDTKVNDFISELVIEGHTSSNGGDSVNIPLSIKRAEAVGEYLVSEEAGLTENQKTALESKLSTVGCASQRLILDENGLEDADASRRVTFRFVFDLDTVLDAIEDLR